MECGGYWFAQAFIRNNLAPLAPLWGRAVHQDRALAGFSI